MQNDDAAPFDYDAQAEAIAQSYVKRLRTAMDDSSRSEEVMNEIGQLISIGIMLTEVLQAIRVSAVEPEDDGDDA